MDWQTIILAIVNNLLEIIVAGGFVILANYLRKKGHMEFVVENKDLLAELANKAVLYAQQKHSNKSNEKRFSIALNWTIKELDRYNIKVDTDIIEGYIESSLKTLKNLFSEEWDNLGKK